MKMQTFLDHYRLSKSGDSAFYGTDTVAITVTIKLASIPSMSQDPTLFFASCQSQFFPQRGFTVFFKEGAETSVFFFPLEVLRTSKSLGLSLWGSYYQAPMYASSTEQSDWMSLSSVINFGLSFRQE